MKRWLFIVLSAFWCAGWSLEVQKIDPTCEAGSCFEDTVRVVLIWNSLTGSAGGCNVSEGAIGEYQKDFVLRSLNSAGIQPCAVLSQPEINAGATVASLTSACGGKPHTIYYLDNGYEWAPQWNPSAPKPDALLLAAAQDSIGLVAVGDDAVVAGSNIFSYMSCPLGTWDACQYVAYGHNDNLGLMDATQDFDGPNDKVYMALDIMEDGFLPDGGLLRGITADTLHFKPHPNATGGSTFDPDLHRCQADADVWEIDRTLLENYSFIGFQKAYSEKGRWSGGEYVHNFGNDLDYRTISALQEDMRRIVILGYQPQFLVDTNASAQLLYNAMFFTSKAKEVPTNMPNPWFVADKQCSDFDTETFIPCQGASWSFAETPKIKLASAFRGAPIYYTVDGSNPQDVCAGFDPLLSPPDGSTACRMFLPETDDGFPITGNTTVLAYTPSGGSWNRLSSETKYIQLEILEPVVSNFAASTRTHSAVAGVYDGLLHVSVPQDGFYMIHAVLPNGRILAVWSGLLYGREHQIAINPGYAQVISQYRVRYIR